MQFDIKTRIEKKQSKIILNSNIFSYYKRDLYINTNNSYLILIR